MFSSNTQQTLKANPRYWSPAPSHVHTLLDAACRLHGECAGNWSKGVYVCSSMGGSGPWCHFCPGCHCHSSPQGCATQVLKCLTAILRKSHGMTAGVWIARLKADYVEHFDQLVEISIPAGSVLLGFAQCCSFHLEKKGPIELMGIK